MVVSCVVNSEGCCESRVKGEGKQKDSQPSSISFLAFRFLRKLKLPAVEILNLNSDFFAVRTLRGFH